MNVIFLRNPYPFTLDEYRAIEKTLQDQYQVLSVTYVREYQGNGQLIDHLIINGGNKRTVSDMAFMAEAFHKMAYYRDQLMGTGHYPDFPQLEVVIRDIYAGRPSWAEGAAS